jgi:hypothetical protein
MIVLVTGGRDFADEALLYATLDGLYEQSFFRRLIHGGCRDADDQPFRGADGLADRWARVFGVAIEAYPVSNAEWTRLGKKAGPLRNGLMVKRAGELANKFGVEALCVAFPGGRGTADCMRQARGARVRVLEVLVGENLVTTS